MTGTAVVTSCAVVVCFRALLCLGRRGRQLMVRHVSVERLSLSESLVGGTSSSVEWRRLGRRSGWDVCVDPLLAEVLSRDGTPGTLKCWSC